MQLPFYSSLHKNQFHFNFFSIFPFRQAKELIRRIHFLMSFSLWRCFVFTSSRSSTSEILFEVKIKISHQLFCHSVWCLKRIRFCYMRHYNVSRCHVCKISILKYFTKTTATFRKRSTGSLIKTPDTDWSCHSAKGITFNDSKIKVKSSRETKEKTHITYHSNAVLFIFYAIDILPAR